MEIGAEWLESAAGPVDSGWVGPTCFSLNMRGIQGRLPWVFFLIYKNSISTIIVLKIGSDQLV